MIVSIHQPSYYPWLGLLKKIASSETFVLMDEVQLSDSLYQHRNLFLTSGGTAKYLTIPFEKKDYLLKKFLELGIRGNEWQLNHSNFIKENYRKHPYFKVIYEKINFIYEKEYTRLIDVVLDSMKISFELFGIKTKLILQSDLEYDRESRKSDLVFNLVKAVNADVYLSGTGGLEYLDMEKFKNSGITVEIQKFQHPTYTQKNAKEFIAGLACLDILFNLGVEGSRNLLHLDSMT